MSRLEPMLKARRAFSRCENKDDSRLQAESRQHLSMSSPLPVSKIAPQLVREDCQGFGTSIPLQQKGAFPVAQAPMDQSVGNRPVVPAVQEATESCLPYP